MQHHYQNPSIPTTEDSLAFIVEWFDKLASIDRPFRLIFYPYDHSIEIIDLKTKRQTLKRIKNDGISPNDLYIGNFLDIYGRRYKVVDYADQSTKELLFARKERTFALIKPDAYSNIGKIIDIIIANGFQINRAQMLRLNEEMVSLMFQDQANRPHFKEFCKFMMSDVAVGLEIVGENSIERMQIITGPESPTLAKEGSQNERDKMSIRAVFGTDHTKNAIHVSRDEQGYRKEMEIFFNEKYTLHAGCQTAVLNNCSLCIIKPHAVQSGLTGKIIDRILEDGFEISALQSFFLDRHTADDFFELYKGVLTDYSQMLDQMVSGPCIVMEIRQENVVASFKAICGCYDPKIGASKAGEKDTIRQLFGIDRIRNAVHCSDLPEEGPIEVEYFFVLLQERKVPFS